MKRILIYKKIIENGEYDILNNIDYNKISQTVKFKYKGISPNWANRLWLQGIYSEIISSENSCDFLQENMSIEEINNKYDLIILPMANIFWVGHIDSLEHLSEVFEKVKVPTFVIACGVQAESYDDLPTLIEQLKVPAQRFIRSIYKTGGEFALRGEFTKEFFDKLGFHSAVVTGCPSMYQFGRELKVNKLVVDRDVFKPIFNGRMSGISKFFKEYPTSIYFDQCDYFPLIYCTECWGNGGYKDIKKLVKKYGYDAVLLATQSRIKLFPEMQKWYSFLKSDTYHFSFGSRIHGNVMSILSGIPAVVWSCDSRTREMAEFFDIPHVPKVPSDIYELYQKIDYAKFNKKFPERFDAFEQFLKKYDIVKQININNIFLDIHNNDDNFDDLWENPPHVARNLLKDYEIRLKFGQLTSNFVDRLKKI